MKASYHVRYKLATGGVFGWEVTAVLQASSIDDAWQDACATLDDLIPSFDDRNLQVERVRAPDKARDKKKAKHRASASGGVSEPHEQEH